MIKNIFFIVLMIAFFNSNAADKYLYADRYIEIVVATNVDGFGREIIILKLKPLVPILVLDNDGCFNLDTTSMKCSFRNIDCPFYLLSKNVNSIYKTVPKDSVLIYEWRASNDKFIKFFSFNVEYITTTQKEYAAKRKRFSQAVLASGAKGLSIKPEDEELLRSRAYLDIHIECL
jgi:hypothetical protein